MNSDDIERAVWFDPNGDEYHAVKLPEKELIEWLIEQNDEVPLEVFVARYFESLGCAPA